MDLPTQLSNANRRALDWEQRFDSERRRFDEERGRCRHLEQEVERLRNDNWSLRRRVAELEALEANSGQINSGNYLVNGAGAKEVATITPMVTPEQGVRKSTAYRHAETHSPSAKNSLAECTPATSRGTSFSNSTPRGRPDSDSDGDGSSSLLPLPLPRHLYSDDDDNNNIISDGRDGRSVKSAKSHGSASRSVQAAPPAAAASAAASSTPPRRQISTREWVRRLERNSPDRRNRTIVGGSIESGAANENKESKESEEIKEREESRGGTPGQSPKRSEKYSNSAANTSTAEGVNTAQFNTDQRGIDAPEDHPFSPTHRRSKSESKSVISAASASASSNNGESIVRSTASVLQSLQVLKLRPEKAGFDDVEGMEGTDYISPVKTSPSSSDEDLQRTTILNYASIGSSSSTVHDETFLNHQSDRVRLEHNLHEQQLTEQLQHSPIPRTQSAKVMEMLEVKKQQAEREWREKRRRMAREVGEQVRRELVEENVEMELVEEEENGDGRKKEEEEGIVGERAMTRASPILSSSMDNGIDTDTDAIGPRQPAEQELVEAAAAAAAASLAADQTSKAVANSTQAVQRLEQRFDELETKRTKKEEAWAAAIARRVQQQHANGEDGHVAAERWEQRKREAHQEVKEEALVDADAENEDEHDRLNNSTLSSERIQKDLAAACGGAGIAMIGTSRLGADEELSGIEYKNDRGSNEDDGHEDNDDASVSSASTDEGYISIASRSRASRLSRARSACISLASKASFTRSRLGTDWEDGEDDLHAISSPIDRELSEDEGTRRSRERRRVVAVARKVIAKRSKSVSASERGGDDARSTGQRSRRSLWSRKSAGAKNQIPRDPQGDLKQSRSTDARDRTGIPAVISVQSDEMRAEGESIEEQTIAIIGIMRSRPTNLDTQRSGCEELAKNAVYAKNAEIIAQAGGAAVIAHAMVRHAADKTLQEMGCSILWNLSRRSERNKDLIADADGIIAILGAMRNHSDVRQIQENAAGALWCLASRSERNKAAIFDSGGLDVLISSMKRYCNVPGICEHVAGICWNMCWQNEARRIAIRSAGAIPIILQAMKRHVRRVGVCEQCCGMIWNAALNADNQTEIMQSGGIKTILVTMKHHEMMSGIAEHSIGALYNLSLSEEGATAIIAFGGVGAIISSAAKHESVPGVQEEACAALASFAVYDSAAGRNCVEEALGFTILIASLKRHPRNETVQQNAILALMRMSHSSETAQYLKSKSVRSLLEAAKKSFPDTCADNVNLIYSMP